MTSSPTPSSTGSDASIPIVSDSAKWWVLLAIGISTFMSALDGSVVNTTLPIITQQLGATVASTEWVVTIYLLVISGLLLSFGRLGDLRGHKVVFLAGFAVFLFSSVICGMARSVTTLVVFRAIQALGAAMLSANSPAILTKSFPPSQRGQALGLQATMTYLGLTAGPSLGGWIAEISSWRSVFYINIPVGLIAFLLSLRYVPADRKTMTAEQFDIKGAAAFMVGLVVLLFGLNQGHAFGWTSPVILASLLAAPLILILFYWIERTTSAPMLDLSLFRSLVFSVSVGSAILNYICVYTITFLMPFYLIQGRGFSSSQAGLLLTTMPIVMALIAPLSGTLSDRIGPRIPTIIGMLVLALGLFLMSQFDLSTSVIEIGFYTAIVGLGIGIFISPNNSALMGAAPRPRQGIAAGIMATSRNLGMVLGVGMAGAIYITTTGHAITGEGITSAVRLSFLTACSLALMGSILTALKPSIKDIV